MIMDYKKCNLCPRNCQVNRYEKPGYCGATAKMKISRAALHFWEEPCISGKNGSGAVFFTNCSLKCIFCQNEEISFEGKGIEIDENRLANIFLELQEKGANNINLVTPMHYALDVKKAIDLVYDKLNIPILINTGGYEKIETIDLFKDKVKVWLPDYKYADPNLAKRYSNAYDYPEVALNSIEHMFQISGKPIFDDNNIIKQGVIVRHLLLPGELVNSMKALKILWDTFQNNIILSLMSQYTPNERMNEHKLLSKRVPASHYKTLVDYALDLGFDNFYTQESDSSDKGFLPDFNFEGVLNE